jgi:hypothetical protein
MGGVMGEQKQLFEIVLLSLEASLDGCQLAIVPNSFFFESLNDLVVGLLDGLSLIVLDHHFIEPILKQAYSFHHGVFFNIP